MSPTDRAARFRGVGVLGALVAFLVLIAALVAKQATELPSKPVENESSVKPGKTSNEPLPTYVYFRDGSILKLILREERIEFVTPYGKLLIPVTDIHRIDFGLHIDARTAKRIEAAIAALGSTDAKDRETATTELLDLGENALPALVEATNSKDAEVVRRANAIVSKLREKLPPDRLERPANDVVVTADCKFTGRISADILKVKTFQFGDQQVKLGDLVSLGSNGPLDPESTFGQQRPTFGGPGGPGFPGGFGPGGRGPGGRRPIGVGPGGPGIPGGAGPEPGGPGSPGGAAPSGDAPAPNPPGR
jgi:hypothetical protein